MNGKKIQNNISGVWNSSDIGLDLGKLHNQIQTLEHSPLDFTAAGAANDLFHTFSNFISEKNILSNIFSYATIGAYSFASYNHSSLYCQDSSAERSETLN